MADTASPSRSDLLAEIGRDFAQSPVDTGPAGPGFLARYFRLVADEDLAIRTAGVLAGSAAAHIELARERAGHETKVAVFNPTTERDGWSSARTVVQIVTDDMPFLVDSIASAITGGGHTIHLLFHPQFVVRRDADGTLLEILDQDPGEETRKNAETTNESWMLLTIDRESDEAARAEIERSVRSVLDDVRAAVEDWPKMRTRCLVLAAELEGDPPRGIATADVARAVNFLRWMADNHFTFLGFREYALAGASGGGGAESLSAVPGTGLGLLRADSRSPGDGPALSAEASAVAHEQTILVLTKANSKSTVHRPAYLDYVGIKAFDAAGQVVGERRFLGLYAATAYTDSVMRLPLVSEKVQEVLDRSGAAPDSHTGKDLLGILETYPRDELFQATVDELSTTAMAVLHLQERRRTKLFIREDEFGRFASCLVYIPRDRYNTSVRTGMAAILKETFAGESVEFTARVSESAMSRLQFVVRMPKGVRIRKLSAEEREAVEERLVEVSRTWTDRLGDALRQARGEVESDRLLDRFGRGFPVNYEESFTVSQGVADLRHLDRLTEERRTSVALYRPADTPENIRRFKLFRVDPLSLTDILPIFTDMGVEVVDEQPFEVTRSDGTALHVYDFGLRVPDETVWTGIAHDTLRELFEGAVLAVWDGRAESDGFNRLVLSARLTWRQVVILRTIAKYLRQTQATFSPNYFMDALVSNPAIGTDLVELFETRFDPERFDGIPGVDREVAERALGRKVLRALEDVGSLDHDRIIRSFVAVINAALRTNFYQEPTAADAEREGKSEGGEAPAYKSYLSLKLNPKALPDLPAPRPAYEIWVYSPRVEGVHLRFGPVARGGLRWSDRREDFRTEILGLVKAQMVKNAVIVPTGSKGGFYAKQLPDPGVDRGAWLEEGKAAYRVFISGLLDLTDNRVGEDIVGPPRVIRHDGDDSYLVVAADKGTASFSDIANGVAQSYGFWLDDAFASGGSAGYDHKAMGITARGAWESVKRHFRELGHDTQTEDFTVVGIGDMSGDVFGNGMLLSEHIRLVAAFDHRHIFIDPEPVAAQGFAERRRLFELPQSSWADYNADLISEGGGVFARSLKSIDVTEPMRQALGLPADTATMTPTELLKAVLQAPVDLLWNGGIGTYVKGSSEDHREVGDRANDAIRIDGRDLRVQVVGEGGNLGFTQLGRIEAALEGVRINTDAIDNSAGVDTSDHEVNIKILLGSPVRRGELSVEDRNVLLESMTEDVAAHVLRDNYEQNVLLGNARAQQHQMASVHERLMRALEERGDLDRQLEFLPSDAELHKRVAEGGGLSSPEFAVLVAYAKLALKHDINASGLPDDGYFGQTLAEYFPPPLRETYAADLASHPLRREIITNAVVNSVVNRGGITFAFRAEEEVGATPEQVARAFVVCREIFGLQDFVRSVEELDNAAPSEVQTELYLEFRRLLDRAVRWFITNRSSALDIQAEIERYAAIVADVASTVPGLLEGDERKRLEARAARLEESGVPRDLALRTSALLDQYSLLDIADIAQDTGRPATEVAALYYNVSNRFGIDSMLTKVSKLSREDSWDALARGALRDDLYAVLESLTRAVLAGAKDSGPIDDDALLRRWVEENQDQVDRATRATDDVRALDAPNIAALSVALRGLRSMVRTGTTAAGGGEGA
jgi:glutamate dehydrogenase